MLGKLYNSRHCKHAYGWIFVLVGALVLIATIVCVFMNTFESGLNEQIFFDERYAYEEKISSKTIECEIDRKSCLVSAIHKIE